jgi:NTP pyrophosphatase (non-canonical NTP hydrolase)
MTKITTFESYQKNALRTKSDTSVNFYGEKVSLQTLEAALEGFIKYGILLNQIKKAIFYGKEYQNFNVLGNAVDYEASEVKGLNLDTIHAILGTATEAVEQAELLRDVIINGQPFDLINYKEELGDTFWYLAIALKAIDTSASTIWSQNISKLEARYPSAFTTEAANTRDLEAERDVLASFEPTPPTLLTPEKPSSTPLPSSQTKVNKLK